VSSSSMEKRKWQTLWRTMTCSEEAVDRLLHSLLVISQVRTGDKLGEESGQLRVMAPGLQTALTRWIRGDRRDRNIHHVAGILDDTFMLAQHYMLAWSGETSLSRPNLGRELRRIHETVELALSGIRQLRLTYMDDVNARTQLQLLQQKYSCKNQDLATFLRARALLSPLPLQTNPWNEEWELPPVGDGQKSPSPRKNGDGERSSQSSTNCATQAAPCSIFLAIPSSLPFLFYCSQF